MILSINYSGLERPGHRLYSPQRFHIAEHQLVAVQQRFNVLNCYWSQ